MERTSTRYHYEPQVKHYQHTEGTLTTAILAYVIALLLLVYQLLYYFDYPISPITEVIWNALVYITPTRLLLEASQRRDLGHSAMRSQVHAAKSESLRRILGVGSQALLQQVPATASLVRRMSLAPDTGTGSQSSAPPGLGNWDNSCYQNSILQGLSSLKGLSAYLGTWSNNPALPGNSTVASLEELTFRLRNATNNGRRLWTPATLKNMSSWQQQDAQEYFSKIVDELDKEVGKAARFTESKNGLETVDKERSLDEVVVDEVDFRAQNPLEGYLSQRVACTSCGFSDGLTMIPFNCLTVPLGSEYEYDLSECLDEYSKLEAITDVECAKCTLLKARKDLEKMLPAEPLGSTTSPDGDTLDKSLLQLPPEVRVQVAQRLAAVRQAMESDDFSDETINKSCQISKKARVSSTKTRQALIARPPQSLVIHVNRSVFDEMTGMQRKNYAAVRYPLILDMGPWIMSSEKKSLDNTVAGFAGGGLPRESEWKYMYRLKAVITHYGRHENGHYIAYRQSPSSFNNDASDTMSDADSHDPNSEEPTKPRWWRLSDEEVTPVSEANLLSQGGVFMLFYERTDTFTSPTSPCEPDGIATAQSPTVTDAADTDSKPVAEITLQDVIPPVAVASALMLDVSDVADGVAMSEASATEDESEADVEEQERQHVPYAPPSPLTMRTAGATASSHDHHGHGHGDGHWNVGRVVAAT